MSLLGTKVRVIVRGVEDDGAQYEVRFDQRAVELGPDDVSNALPTFVCHLWQIMKASALPGRYPVFVQKGDVMDSPGDVILDIDGNLEWEPTGSKIFNPENRDDQGPIRPPSISDN